MRVWAFGFGEEFPVGLLFFLGGVVGWCIDGCFGVGGGVLNKPCYKDL